MYRSWAAVVTLRRQQTVSVDTGPREPCTWNGESCVHHPIPKVSNPDVPVLGCGCHPQTAADGIGGHWTT